MPLIIIHLWVYVRNFKKILFCMYSQPFLRNKEVVVLNIFASWCGPCEKEFPDMEKTYQKYKDKMEIVAVSGDLVLDDLPAPYIPDTS